MTPYTDDDVIAARDALVRDPDYERLNPLARQYAGRIAERLVAAVAPQIAARALRQAAETVASLRHSASRSPWWVDAIDEAERALRARAEDVDTNE